MPPPTPDAIGIARGFAVQQERIRAQNEWTAELALIQGQMGARWHYV